ncbi:MAG TPA: hypothetical protein VK569_00210 [Bacteroidota bacterium]|nr:hypothetical protein [Bacteroidota bacterium]
MDQEGRIYRFLFPAALLLALIPDRARPAAPADTARPPRLFAAAFIVRGSVSGSATGGYGVYVRGAPDTGWTRITRSSTLTFGIALFDNGRTRRYYIAAGNGVHRSTDGGKSWRILTTWRTEEILCVVPDPVDSSLVYAATPFGAFRTTDDGATWQKKMEGIPTGFVQRIVMDARDSRTLYAATESDLFVSTDGADHWRAMGSGLGAVLALLQSRAHPGVIIAAGEFTGVRRTTDGGKTWQAVRGLDSSVIYTFRASDAGADIYAAGWKSGIWRSTDEGASWRQVWSAPGIEAFYSLFVYPGAPDHLLAGTVGEGIMESLDRGSTWRAAGLPGTQVKQIELYP